jgi:site-specific recombinase
VATLGVVLVGFVNVAVSFGLAFATAFRARHVRYERGRLVIRLVLKRLVRRPWDFVWPPAAVAPGVGRPAGVPPGDER